MKRIIFLLLLFFSFTIPAYAAGECTVSFYTDPGPMNSSIANNSAYTYTGNSIATTQIRAVIQSGWYAWITAGMSGAGFNNSGDTLTFVDFGSHPAPYSTYFTIDVAVGDGSEPYPPAPKFYGSPDYGTTWYLCDSPGVSYHIVPAPTTAPVASYLPDEEVLGATSDLVSSMGTQGLIAVAGVMAATGGIVISVFGIKKILWHSRKMLNGGTFGNGKNNFSAREEGYYTYRGHTGFQHSANSNQKSLEDAWNSNNDDEARRIINSMDDSDPYKESMMSIQKMRDDRNV